MQLFQMSYTDTTDTNHPQSVWLPSSINIDPVNDQVSIEWDGYSTDTARMGGYESVGKHTTTIDGRTYQAFMANPAPTGTYQQALGLAAVQFGQSISDTPNGQKNSDGTNMLVPFFLGATIITDSV